MADSARQLQRGLIEAPPARRAGAFWIKAVLLLGLLSAAGLAAVKYWPVRYVRIEGVMRQIDPAALQAALEPVVEGAYLRVDLNKVEAAVRTVPWVGEVSVTRLWPETLVVRLEELSAYARCNDGSFISEKGVRFHGDASVNAANLPLIHGPEGYEKPMLAMLKTMNAKLAPLGRRIAVLHLSNRRAWTLRLDDGLVVAMGRQDPLAAFDRFQTMAVLMGPERLQAVQRVDLRYPNGCAVSMKPKAESAPGAMEGGEKKTSWDAMNKTKA